MQLKILLLLILFSAIGSMNAQLRVGILGGFNSTGFSGDNPANSSFSSGLGYNVGANIDIFFLEDVAINLQPMHSFKSTSIQYDVYYQYEKYDSININITYFEIPMNIKVIANNKIAFATTGLTLSIPLNATMINNRSKLEEELKENLAAVIISANFGVGAQFQIGKPLFFFELRYSQSLTNLNELAIGSIEKLKSNSMQLYLGLLFNLY